MYKYRGKLLRVIDGDTARFKIDLGFNVFIEETMRLVGINTPEIRRPASDEEIAKGKKAAGKLEFFCFLYESRDQWLTLKTDKDLKGKFGRYLVTIIGVNRQTGEEININNLMVDYGYATQRED